MPEAWPRESPIEASPRSEQTFTRLMPYEDFDYEQNLDYDHQ
jgi:hypothetical protein